MIGTGVRAVSFDFFHTLVHHRVSRGRGGTVMAYLTDAGYAPTPWHHSALYDIFEAHDQDHDPDADAATRRRYHVDLAARTFARLGVDASRADAERHAAPLWKILGPDAFTLYPDVVPALNSLRADGIPVAIISNWQAGLQHFVRALRLGDLVDVVVGSADLGVAKPDSRIFLETARRLGVPPGEILHIGDTLLDDVEGAIGAGFQALLLDRDDARPESPHPRIATLMSSRVVSSIRSTPGCG